MGTKGNNWKLQKSAFDNNLHQALLQQHHAAQFVAMVGRQLIPQQPDDSNTNMQNVIEKGFKNLAARCIIAVNDEERAGKNLYGKPGQLTG